MSRFSAIELYYDGTNIEKYGSMKDIGGFTTNTTFMIQGGKTNYPEFYESVKDIVKDRPISLQLFSSDPKQMNDDAYKISSYGPNVYVKIPIIQPNGESNVNTIGNLAMNGIKVNVTAIFTMHQVLELYHKLWNKNIQTPMIVSIFAGRISDTCVDPKPFIQFVCKLLKPLTYIKVLWAGCKETLSIQHAIDVGCHIITIPDSILDRLSRVDKDLFEFSKETVQGFNNDGKAIHL